MKGRRVEWPEIADNAKEMFLLPFGIRELEWAELAWNVLSSCYLTVYHNELERHIVLIRLITLATLFHEFAYIAWDWRYDPSEDYIKWANGLGLNSFRIGQLVDRHFLVDRPLDDRELLRRAIGMLVESERKTVHWDFLRACQGADRANRGSLKVGAPLRELGGSADPNGLPRVPFAVATRESHGLGHGIGRTRQASGLVAVHRRSMRVAEDIRPSVSTDGIEPISQVHRHHAHSLRVVMAFLDKTALVDLGELGILATCHLRCQIQRPAEPSRSCLGAPCSLGPPDARLVDPGDEARVGPEGLAARETVGIR